MNDQREMKEKIERLSQMLEDGTRRFRSSEQWKEYLKFQAKMPAYSYNNTMLILLQTKGSASMCQSFSGWKACGRYVKAGEKGIQIICPAPRKVYSIRDKKDENGNTILRPDGSPEKVRESQIIPAYKVGYTFDISQTEGKEVPEICKRLDGSVEGAEKFISVLKEISPVPISFERIGGSANGFYSPSQRKIVVEESLDPNHQIHTCLHEIAHATLDLNGLDRGASRELKETEAESISYIVM
nr:ssDNA-binding domain-containing protein [Lachnospiraceae bacterium]